MLGYIERFGTGIPRIVEAYSDASVSPRFTVRAESVTVVLPVVDAVSLSGEESLLLRRIPKGTRLSRAEIAAAAGLSKDKTLRLLNGLVGKGLLEVTGSARATRCSHM